MVEVQIGLRQFFFQYVTRLVEEYLPLGVRLGNKWERRELFTLMYTSELFELCTRNLCYSYKNKRTEKYLYSIIFFNVTNGNLYRIVNVCENMYAYQIHICCTRVKSIKAVIPKVLTQLLKLSFDVHAFPGPCDDQPVGQYLSNSPEREVAFS